MLVSVDSDFFLMCSSICFTTYTSTSSILLYEHMKNGIEWIFLKTWIFFFFFIVWQVIWMKILCGYFRFTKRGMSCLYGLKGNIISINDWSLLQLCEVPWTVFKPSVYCVCIEIGLCTDLSTDGRSLSAKLTPINIL